MTDVYPKLPNPPIVEAIVDFDCDVPPNVALKDLEQSARDAFREQYPDVHPRYLQEVRVATAQDGAFNSSLQRSLQAWMFKTQDGKQLVQVRQSGFSFNRLAPYPGFDACLPEIKRAWSKYCELVQPIELRGLRLRYINRILLPAKEVAEKGFHHFLSAQTGLPRDVGLVPSGFLNQYQGTDPQTHLQVAVVVASQPPEGEKLPVMFDNSVFADAKQSSFDWDSLTSMLKSLRALKNRVFFKTVQPPCLEWFK